MTFSLLSCIADEAIVQSKLNADRVEAAEHGSYSSSESVPHEATVAQCPEGESFIVVNPRRCCEALQDLCACVSIRENNRARKKQATMDFSLPRFFSQCHCASERGRCHMTQQINSILPFMFPRTYLPS